MQTTEARQGWTRAGAREIYDLPLNELLFRAQTAHREHHDPKKVQVCQLLSIKTGGCPEDCAYCSQSVRYETPVDEEPLVDVDDALAKARTAKENGASRFCMGAAWRGVGGAKGASVRRETYSGSRSARATA